MIFIPFDDPCSQVYERVRSDLARMGALIGPIDLMIAAISLNSSLILVTANTREFGRVDRMSLENWENL